MAGSTKPIRILSAGAPKGGVTACAEAFIAEAGRPVEIDFATAPVLRGTVERGEAAADIVVAPVEHMKGFEDRGQVTPGSGVVVGSVKAGVAVRAGGQKPDLSSAETLKWALMSADSVVYNEASSGQYVAQMIAGLGIAEAIESHTVRLPTGSDVMSHLARSEHIFEIGFGQIPEIRRFEDRGVELAGALPEEIGKITTYAAGLLSDAAAPGAAKALLAFMASAEARLLYAKAGLE